MNMKTLFISALLLILNFNLYSQSNNLFKVYPNPVTTELKINSSEQIVKIEIYNILGAIELTTNQNAINVQELKPGIYFAKAYSSKGIAIQKFIKQ